MAEKKPSGFRFRLPWLLQPALPPAREPPTQPPRTATQTSVSSTPTQRPPFRPPGKAPSPPPPSVLKTSAKTIEPDVSQSMKETQTTIGPLVPSTPPQSPPPSPPPPSASPKSSAPNSPTAKTIEPVASQPVEGTQTTFETVPTVLTMGPATQARTQPSPPQTPPSPKPSQARVPPNSPSQLASKPANKPSSPPSNTTRGNHLTVDEKPREITKLRETQAKFMDLKSQKPKLTATRAPLYREIKDDISKFIHKVATSSAKQSKDEKPANIITIAGDNTGATMHLGLDEIKRGYKLNTDTNAHDSAINGEGSSRRDSKSGENTELKAIVNNNIQGINNSIVFNSSVTERNPGVHLGLYRNPTNVNDSMMKNTESIEMQRAEVNITPPEKLVYDPTMEASEFEFEEDDSETSTRGCEIEVL